MANLIVVCHGESHRPVTAQGLYESDPSQAGITPLPVSHAFSLSFIRAGNARFAIRKRTYAASALNCRCGSTPAFRGCDTIDRYCDACEGQPSARNGRLLCPRPRSACGSQSGRSNNAPHTAGSDLRQSLVIDSLIASPNLNLDQFVCTLTRSLAYRKTLSVWGQIGHILELARNKKGCVGSSSANAFRIPLPVISVAVMHRKSKDWSVFRKWRKLIGGGPSFAEDAVPASDMAQQMEQASVLSLSFCLMLSLAGAIATFGLIANSAPAIIGAMIIAPLMSPIMSLSYGLVAFEKELIFRSALTVIAGVILVVLLGYVITLLFGLRITGAEVLNRTSPTLIDLAVAMAAGGAAAFANTRRSILSSIAGVAIAVALVPPLAVSGIGLALGRKATAEAGMSLSEFGLYSGGTDIAQGAFLLFLTNFIGIVAVAILVFVCQRIGEWKKALLALLLCLGLSAVLFEPLNRELHELYVKHRVTRLIAKLSFERPDIVTGKGKTESINVVYRDGLLHVNIDGFMPKDELVEKPGELDLQRRLERFREILSNDIGEPVVVELDFIPIDIIQMRAEPRNPQKESPLQKQ